MAGGTWKNQNKARPGVYINVAAKNEQAAFAGERGVLTMPVALNWGPEGTLTTITAGEDTFARLGYYSHEILLLREAFKHAQTVLLYRVNSGGTKATATAENLTITAKYAGTRGNDITVAVAVNADDDTEFDVTTYVGLTEIETQTVEAITGLQANDFVSFSGTGALMATAGTPLTGGADGTATAGNYTAYLNTAAAATFDVMAIPVDDSEIKALAAAFARRMREEEGRKIQVVLADYAAADYEGVISVKNGVILDDGTVIDKTKAVAWVGGATAGAGAAESLTYTEYDGAIAVDTVYTNSEIEAALRSGEFLFAENYGHIVVEQDINTLVTYGDTKNYALSKNRVIRALDGYLNDLQRACTLNYIGRIGNDSDGRNTIKAYAIRLASEYEAMGALQDFDSENDISVSAGAAIDAVVLEAYLQPVDSVEKIYATITVGEAE